MSCEGNNGFFVAVLMAHALYVSAVAFAGLDVDTCQPLLHSEDALKTPADDDDDDDAHVVAAAAAA